MDTTFNKFCKRYLEKLKNDKDIAILTAEKNYDFLSDDNERITFHVVECSKKPRFLGCNESKILLLDKGDLEYLYGKYSLRLEDEMNENIEKVKKMYEMP